MPTDPEIATTALMPAPPESRRRRQVIAVGGGKSGVGKSLLTVNLGVYLAQLGRNVVLCDVDPFGSGLHTVLGVEHPPLMLLEELREGQVEPTATNVPGLKLMPAAYDPWTMAPKRLSRMAHYTALLDRLDADYVLLNLGASMTRPVLDLFYEADIHVCVAAPEPPSIEATYRFCRALFARRLKRSMMRERFKVRVVERALAKLPPMHTPRELIAELAKLDQSVANIAAAAVADLHPGLVIGKARMRADYELGPAMASLSERYLGVALDYFGYIENDDAVWLTARRRRPLLIDAPTSKGARNIERVARRILALLAQQAKKSRAPQDPIDASRFNAPLTLYNVLGVDRSASDDEIRRAYKLQHNTFRADSLPLVSLVDQRGIEQEQAHIREAFDTLLDPARRRAYDISVFPDRKDEPEPERGPSATEAELAQLQAELAREITPETQFSGALLRRARQARGIGIQDIANITKISAMHLRAIEAEDVGTLPAPVYVRGFLQQIARALRLDPTQVTKTYLKRVRSARPGYE
jgi:flagellar biosynthesis protein FlhG